VPALLALAKLFGARGLRVVGVTVSGEDQEERASVIDAIREEKMDYPTALDPSGAWWNAAEMGVAPTFLIVGKDGRLAYRHSGKLLEGTEAFAKMKAAIDEALGK
jgi:hypothetical protein